MQLRDDALVQGCLFRDWHSNGRHRFMLVFPAMKTQDETLARAAKWLNMFMPPINHSTLQFSLSKVEGRVRVTGELEK